MKQPRMNSTTVLNALLQRHTKDVCVSECKDGPTRQTRTHRRMDLWVMPRSWAKMNITGYEIKVTRSDFLADNKWRSYLPYCHSFYFAAPDGVLDISELPAEAGYMRITNNGARAVCKKKAPFRKVDIPAQVYQYILMCRAEIDPAGGPVDSHRVYWQRWLEKKELDLELGRRVSATLQKRISEEILQVREAQRKLNMRLAGLGHIERFCKEYGLDPTHTHYTLSRTLSEILEARETGLSTDMRGTLTELSRMCTKILTPLDREAKHSNTGDS